MEDAKKEKKLEPRLVKIVMYHNSAVKTLFTILVEHGYVVSKKEYYFITTNKVMDITRDSLRKHILSDSASFEIIQLDTNTIDSEILSTILKCGIYEEIKYLGKRSRVDSFTTETDRLAEDTLVNTGKQISMVDAALVDLDKLKEMASGAMSSGSGFVQPKMIDLPLATPRGAFDDGPQEDFNPGVNS